MKNGQIPISGNYRIAYRFGKPWILQEIYSICKNQDYTKKVIWSKAGAAPALFFFALYWKKYLTFALYYDIVIIQNRITCSYSQTGGSFGNAKKWKDLAQTLTLQKITSKILAGKSSRNYRLFWYEITGNDLQVIFTILGKKW